LRRKISLSIDKQIIEKLRKEAEDKNLSLSRLIENKLKSIVEVPDEDVIEVSARGDVPLPCPKCGYPLDPEDESIETLNVDGECGAHRLYSVTIRCPKCKQPIRIGFQS